MYSLRNGIQQRRTSWQDGVSGTNCPIPPTWNWTYNFQVKDQIGSFFYFPSLNFQRAGGGFGGFTITPRSVIPVPFGTPDGDFTILIGDWYNAGHKVSGLSMVPLSYPSNLGLFVHPIVFYFAFFSSI